MLTWVAEVLRWAPLDSGVERGVVGGAMVLVGVVGVVIAARLRDDAEGRA